MPLDKNNTTQPYLTGRMIAIVEHYAAKKFGPHTLTNMFSHPAYNINVFTRYIDTNDEYYRELADTELPVTTKNEAEKSQMWMGYYHQKTAYDENTPGGYRPNSGRPANDRKIPVSVRISPEANEFLSKQPNKSEYIDELIKRDQANRQESNTEIRHFSENRFQI